MDTNKIPTITLLSRNPFKHQTTTVGNLPTAFVDSLSYYEQLAWLCNYVLVKIIPKINENSSTINELVAGYNDLKDYVDQHVADVDELRSEFIELTNRLEAELTTMDENIRSLINSEITRLRIELTSLVNSNHEACMAHCDARYDELNTKIENIDISAFKVLNPATGRFEPIQDVLNALYEQFRTEAITAAEYDALELTAAIYDNKEIEATLYDMQGKTILMAV